MFRRLLAVAAIVVTAIGLIATYRHLRPGNLKPIGGDWHIRPVSSYWAGHSASWDDLYRRSGFLFLRVGSEVTRYRFYPPDCVLFESQRRSIRERSSGNALPGVIVAVCGDRTPIPIALNTGHTRYQDDGLVTTSEVRTITQIRELANQQPPYRHDWHEHAMLTITEEPSRPE